MGEGKGFFTTEDTEIFEDTERIKSVLEIGKPIVN